MLLILLKIQIESESQPIQVLECSTGRLLLILLKIQIESESQPKLFRLRLKEMLLLILLKIQIESESQLEWLVELVGRVVAYPSKNTNWKRITTCSTFFLIRTKLLLILLKIQIESESQLIRIFLCQLLMLLLILLKIQIESESQQERSLSTCYVVVAYPSKNTNWKRITTYHSFNIRDSGCCLSF